jgi:hypothetical protein
MVLSLDSWDFSKNFDQSGRISRVFILKLPEFGFVWFCKIFSGIFKVFFEVSKNL